MNTGWIKDKYDPRDYPHQGYRLGATQVPDVVDLSALLPPRIDQDGMNGCVGAALRTAIGAAAKSQTAFSQDYSWIWPWAGARFIEGTLAQNVGVYPRDALQWLADNGCLFDQFMPFSGQFEASAPSSNQISRAVKYAGFGYYRVGDGAQGMMESLAESLASLQSGGPAWLICLGAPWFEAWDSAPAGAMVAVTKDSQVSGGHETVIYGYDKAQGVFYLANSWGTGWGADGLARLPFEALDVFKSLGGYDAQYLTFKADPAPAPPDNRSGCSPLVGLLKLFKVNSTQFCMGG